jgi:hypothetical protein
MVDQYWPAVQQKVCVKCIDGDRHGNCRLSPQFQCALKVYFPQVVHVVQTTKSDNILNYVASLRREVCSKCREQLTDGRCYVRAMLDCPLDRYFPRIIEAIEEIHQMPVT